MADTLQVPTINLISPSKTAVSKTALTGPETKSMTTSKIRSKSRLMAESSVRVGNRKSSKAENEEEQWEVKQPVKPADQLVLTPEELNQEFTRILKGNNPHAPHNIIRFNQKEREFKQIAQVEQAAFHFSLQGNLLHIESDEARRQQAKQGKRQSKVNIAAPDGAKDAVAATASTGTGDDDEEGDDEAPKILRNQFNFAERASQTFNYTLKERETVTEPPPRANFSATATQWAMYDAYAAELARQEALKSKKGKASEGDEKASKKNVDLEERTAKDEGAWSAAAKILQLPEVKKVERMLNQNSFDDVLQDFKYWEDPSDEFKSGRGSVLPLWKFNSDLVKKFTITSIKWNPLYKDLFAVSYGSYDFLKQSGGAVACFTLKNTGFPEYQVTTKSGVLCLDFHPTEASLLAVGFYDGSVGVFDMRSKSEQPIYLSTPKSGKHTDPVWQVSWQADDLDKNKNFTSVSSDGRVTLWTLIKSEIHHTDLIVLRQDPDPAKKEVDEALVLNNCGTCFDFNPSDDTMYLVGTEEGVIRRCSKAYSSKFLSSYSSHKMSVYTVAWNPLHSRVFASCSTDWSVKIWDYSSPNPVFSFDLGSSVGDVCWAPYSSTVFAAVTSDGLVVVYDLAIDKYEPLCQQQVAKKGKLTRITFNAVAPIVLVGDDRGNVVSFKLSPNLRKALADKKSTKETQFAAMEKLLEAVKEVDA